MADEYVEFEVDVADKASPKLSRLEKNIGKVGGAVDRASSNFMGMVKQSAMFAGFFALGPAIQGAKNYIDHLDKISDLSGMAADKAGGISNALQASGVSASTVESVFGKLVKKGAKLGEGNKALIKQAKAYGVELKGGPGEALITIADKMAKGELSVGGMQSLLKLSSSEAAEMADAMSQGGDALKKKIEEATKKNAAFSEGAMAGMQEYQNASSRVGVAWNRMTASIMIKLAPAMTKLANKFEGSIDGWSVKAEKFGDFLVKHMDKIIAMAKTYAKIMLVNAAVQKLGGGGIVSLAGKGLTAFKGRAAALASGGAPSGIFSVLKSLLPAFNGLRPIISGLMRLAPIGLVIMVVVAAFKAISTMSADMRTRLTALFGSIWDRVKSIGSSISNLFSSDGPFGAFIEIIGGTFLNSIELLGHMIDRFLALVQKVINVLGGPSPMDLVERSAEANRLEKFQRKIWKGSAEDLEASVKKMRGEVMAGTFGATTAVPMEAPKAPKAKDLTGKKDPGLYQDFRGSRFDIKQAFAEGYDPDRIATAFSNELGSVGERKLQSGFAPLFTVR